MNKYLSIEGAFQTGSSLIKKDYGDIDIVIPLSSLDSVDEVWPEIKFSCASNGYGNDKTLNSTYRDGEFNLIIVKDEFYDLWVEATGELVTNPHLYQDKQARVDMFRRIKGS